MRKSPKSQSVLRLPKAPLPFRLPLRWQPVRHSDGNVLGRIHTLLLPSIRWQITCLPDGSQFAITSPLLLTHRYLYRQRLAIAAACHPSGLPSQLTAAATLPLSLRLLPFRWQTISPLPLPLPMAIANFPFAFFLDSPQLFRGFRKHIGNEHMHLRQCLRIRHISRNGKQIFLGF